MSLFILSVLEAVKKLGGLHLAAYCLGRSRGGVGVWAAGVGAQGLTLGSGGIHPGLEVLRVGHLIQRQPSQASDTHAH